MQHIQFIQSDKNKKLLVDKYNKVSKILTITAGIIIIIGFFEYMREKKLEYGKQFKILIFLLGSNKCKSLL